MAHLNPIAVYNYKGGVGKSTVTTALADLAAQQFPTCAVDCDPQCTTSFYMLGVRAAVQKMTETGTIKHLFDWIYSKEAELPREAGSLPITVPNWQAKVICGDMTLTNLEADLILRGQGVSDKIWQSLWRLNDSDLNLWPIIDCSPSYSYFTIAATSCAKGGIFIPVTTDEDSLYGISLTARAIHQLREFYREFNINPGKIRGIICNRVEPRRKLALLRALDYVIDDARAAYPESFTYNFKVLETMLIEDTNLFRTVRAAGKSIASLGPKAPMARLYNSLLEEVLELSQTNVDEY